MSNLETLSKELVDALVSIDRFRTERIVMGAIEENDGGLAIVEGLLISALTLIGEGWENEIYSLSQVYMSGIICEELFLKIIPEQVEINESAPRIAIAVFLDHHALGKRIVKSVILSGGYRVIDLGEGLSVEQLVAEVVKQKIDILLLSTLMLPSALKIIKVREQFDQLNIKTKIIAGGAPFRFDPELWRKVGADADGKNATDMIQTIERVVQGL